MALSSDLLRGYTDTVILCQLAEGDSYGYAISKQINALSGGQLEMKEATLYTAFRRMEQMGLIASYWGTEGAGARRRYYTLTPAGHEKAQEDIEQWQQTRRLLDRLLSFPGRAPKIEITVENE